jgi:hypothetical protein
MDPKFNKPREGMRSLSRSVTTHPATRPPVPPLIAPRVAHMDRVKALALTVRRLRVAVERVHGSARVELDIEVGILEEIVREMGG